MEGWIELNGKKVKIVFYDGEKVSQRFGYIVETKLKDFVKVWVPELQRFEYILKDKIIRIEEGEVERGDEK